MDETEIDAFLSSPTRSCHDLACAAADLVARELGIAAGIDPARTSALVADWAYLDRKQPNTRLAGDLYRLRHYQRQLVRVRDRLAGAPRRLLSANYYDVARAIAGRAKAITGPVGALTGGWAVGAIGFPMTHQLPPDLHPWPDAPLDFPIWRDQTSAEAALKDLRAHDPAPGYSDTTRFRVRWTCFHLGNPTAGEEHILLDEEFWASQTFTQHC